MDVIDRDRREQSDFETSRQFRTSDLYLGKSAITWAYDNPEALVMSPSVEEDEDWGISFRRGFAANWETKEI